MRDQFGIEARGPNRRGFLPEGKVLLFTAEKTERKTVKAFEYTVKTSKSVEDAISTIEQKTTANGFRVLHVHDVAATLAEKGFEREPLKIVEICNAKYAHQVLQKDIGTALMLPCPITVYTRDGATYVSTLLPTVIGQFFPDNGIDSIAAEVERIVVAIVDQSAQ